MSRLSVCLIVRNEEDHLPRCLASVRGLADEIVVVDTGSTDRTVEIARAHGARVYDFPWQDDFSAARNFTIGHATGDWILSLDADESIAARDHAVIRALTHRDDVDAVLAAQRHYLPAEAITPGWQAGAGGYDEGAPHAGFLDVDCRRLFRNRPWLQFQNRVHEELRSLDPARPLVETRAAWVIHHFGKLGDRQLLAAKAEAYLRIGRRKVEDNPDDPQAHYELGIQYWELNQPEAALACHQRAAALSPRFRDVWLRIAFCRHRLGQHAEALEALKVCARTLPEHAAEIASAEGSVHRTLGDDRAAERAFTRALASRPGFPPASLGLAALLMAKGQLDEAVAALDGALRLSPRHASARRMRARVLTMQRRFAEARECLAGMQGEDAELSALQGAIALGLGEIDEAIAALRRSLEVTPTHEAAMNLAAALKFSGKGKAPQEGVPHHLTIFFYQPQSVPFDGTTPRTRGLGGTESAIVYLAEALVARGHRCVVFNNCERPCDVHGVEYARWETMPVRSVEQAPDVVTGVRFWETLGRSRFAPLQILWTGDAFDQPFLQTLGDERSREQVDLFMLQSGWQADTFHAHHGIPRSRVVRTTLGTAASAVDPVESASPAPRGRRLAYASTPFRGLDVLLQLFPRIRAACPDAELDVFSSMQVYGLTEAEDRKQYGDLYRLANQPGVHLIGSVPQLELARRLQQARVLAYPNHYAETFCIAAAEAQAAGCAIVTSQLGALPETVGDGGICIPGDARTPAYQDAFVNACVALLRDDERWRAVSERALAHASSRFAWPTIAAHWEQVCQTALAPEPAELPRIAVHLAGGRAGLAQKMLARTPKPAHVAAETWTALETFISSRAGECPAPADAQLHAVALHFGSLRSLIGTDDRQAARSR